MGIEDFIEKFAFAIEMEPAALAADTDFKALENWDSLNTLSIIAMADADYDVAISGDDILNSRTISDLMKTIQERKA
jgi:acyl carrier protein